MAADSEFYLSFFVVIYYKHLKIFYLLMIIMFFVFEMEVAQAEYFQHTSELKRWVNSTL